MVEADFELDEGEVELILWALDRVPKRSLKYRAAEKLAAKLEVEKKKADSTYRLGSDLPIEEHDQPR